ncbi:hypothetical protein [Maribacter arenosus]|uniref:Uncharacterized protein n=1 Tax=Maribacter arenosus TaxID=1854708 RepID=A0ABR7VEF2_9FLAO|nr:hypothetical protein [Maribacter arenosus]MBD0850532.1 hypothetical protein [Maribacter arenosus]
MDCQPNELFRQDSFRTPKDEYIAFCHSVEGTESTGMKIKRLLYQYQRDRFVPREVVSNKPMGLFFIQNPLLPHFRRTLADILRPKIDSILVWMGEQNGQNKLIGRFWPTRGF